MTVRSRRTIPAPILGVLLAVVALSPAVAPPVAATTTEVSPVPSPSSTPGPTPTPSPPTPPVPTPPTPPGPPPALAWPTTYAGPVALGATVTLYGRGSGHGVGMSQYGARGRALAGQDAATILTHYYTGTSVVARDPSTPVRVLLASGLLPTATPISVTGVGGAWSVDGLPGTFPAGAAATVTGASGAWQLTVIGPDGVPLAAGPLVGSVRIRPVDAAALLRVSFEPASHDLYRGVIRLLASTRISAIDEVPLDQYLRGVVPVEMPSTWPLAALEAQAVAARSYAVRRLHPATGTFDLYDDGRSQYYWGVRAERPGVDAAIAGSAGQVLMTGTGVANTVYCSAAGGATENSELVWTSSSGAVVNRPASELRGAPDRSPAGAIYDAASPSSSWRSATYTQAQFSAILAKDARTNVGTVVALDLSRRGVSGRLISITLIGTLGSKTVSGMLFQSIFNLRRPPGHPMLRSTLFDLVPVPPSA